jgi:hypothetical protein
MHLAPLHRGKAEREKVAAMKTEMSSAAVKIQAAHRGSVDRERVAAMKGEIAMAGAAVKIQSAHRGKVGLYKFNSVYVPIA